MSIICPNFNNKEVKQQFDELVAATSEQAAYHIWSQNEGNAIDRAPNGAPSKLFTDLLEYFNGDRALAIQAKAKTFSKSFKEWFEGSKVVDENGEPLVVYHGTNFEFDSFSKDKRGSYTKAKSATLAFFAASNIKNAEKYLVSESERFQPFRRKDGSEDLFDVFEKQLQENHDDILEAIYKRELELEKDPLFQIEELKNKYGDGYILSSLTIPEFAKKYPEQAKLYKKEVDKIEDKLLLKINPHIKSMFLNIRNPKIDDDKNTGHRANSYNERISDALQEGKDGGVIKNTRDPLDTDVYYFFEQNQAKSATDNTGAFSRENDNIYHLNDKTSYSLTEL